MNKYNCRFCRLDFPSNNIIKFGKTNYGKQRYSCNPCNVKKERKYKNTISGKLSNQIAHDKSIKKHIIKRHARFKLNYEIKNGNILKPNNCFKYLKICVPEGHHPDYSKPLEVDWLCKDCHRLEHRKLRD